MTAHRPSRPRLRLAAGLALLAAALQPAIAEDVAPELQPVILSVDEETVALATLHDVAAFAEHHPAAAGLVAGAAARSNPALASVIAAEVGRAVPAALVDIALAVTAVEGVDVASVETALNTLVAPETLTSAITNEGAE